ncbi:unnamed protein product [Closterium sp. NIES-54]
MALVVTLDPSQCQCVVAGVWGVVIVCVRVCLCVCVRVCLCVCVRVCVCVCESTRSRATGATGSRATGATVSRATGAAGFTAATPLQPPQIAHPPFTHPLLHPYNAVSGHSGIEVNGHLRNEVSGHPGNEYGESQSAPRSMRGRCGRTGKGATDVQTQAFCKHDGMRKHKLALEKQEALLAAATSQPRINEHRAAVDAKKIRVVLLVVLLFVSRCDAPMGTWVKLVQYLAQKGVQGFPEKGYGTYYTTTDRCRGKHVIVYATFIRNNKLVSEFMQLITVEKGNAYTLLSLLLSHLQAVGVEVQRISGISTDGASVMMGSRAGLVVRLRERVPHLVSCHCITHREALAAKEAAEALPIFDMVDDLVRMTADLLRRSAPKQQRFMDLQQLFTETSLEVQGIHQVRWLSQDEAILRILAVWPVVVIFLKEYHSAMYACHLVQLWVAGAVIPLSTVECERGFSRQNVIKSWLQGAPKDARLGDLVCLSLMPYAPVFDEVVDIWRSYKKRKPFSNSPISTPGEPSKKGKVAAMEVEHPKPVDALDLSSDSDDDDEDEEDDVDEDMAYRM